MTKRLVAMFIVIAVLFSGCNSQGAITSLSNTPSHQTAADLPPKSAESPSDDSQPERLPDNLSEGTLEVYFFDVGQADCALVKIGEHAMLIDAGDIGQDDLILSYLHEAGVDGLDYLIATHPHADHIGSMPAVIRTLDVGTLIMPDAVATTDIFSDLLDAVEESGIPLSVSAVGDTYSLGAAEIVILAPTRDYDDLNDSSIVLKVLFGETSFLFTGDAESESEQDQLSMGQDLSADVLKVGHHGSGTSSTKAYLVAVSPSYAVISVGAENSYGHPSGEVLTRLQNMGAAIYRTDLGGTVVFSSDGYTVTVVGSAFEAAPQANPDNTEAEARYIGNINSKVFHKPTCGSLPADKNRVHFESRNEAIQQGYKPCQKCNP